MHVVLVCGDSLAIIKRDTFSWSLSASYDIWYHKYLSCICYRWPRHVNWSQLKMGPLWDIGKRSVCKIMYRSIPKPPMPPRTNPGAFDFLKNFGQIPHYIATLDGQMPHPLELQRGSNPPPSRHVKATLETSSAKFSATTNFLFSLSSLHTLNKGIFHDRTI